MYYHTDHYGNKTDMTPGCTVLLVYWSILLFYMLYLINQEFY